jgi:hypothetical protein
MGNNYKCDGNTARGCFCADYDLRFTKHSAARRFFKRMKSKTVRAWFKNMLKTASND